jgi:hypothetical protein
MNLTGTPIYQKGARRKGRKLRRKSLKPKRGPIRDKKYWAWIHTQPCIVTGQLPVTGHHVRNYGSPKDDRRAVPIIASRHMLTHEKPGFPCVERSKRNFERVYSIDLEAEILRLNALYERTAC